MMFPVVKAGEEIPSLPAFIVGKGGIYLRKETRLGVSTTKVSTVNHLDDVPLELEWALPTIPAEVVGKIVGFLLRCDKERGGEGALLLCLNEKDEWDLIVPRQDNSGMDVKYYIDPDTVPQGWTLIGTVHSHPWGGTPTPSSTDEDDDRKLDGLHIVAGNLGSNPKFNVAAVIDGVRFKWSDPADVLEISGPIDVPDEWLDQVKKKSWHKSSFGFGGSSWGGGSTYTRKLIKTGESPLQALVREREYSLKMIYEDAQELGLKVNITIIDEDGNEHDPREVTKVEQPKTYLPTKAPEVPMNGKTNGEAVQTSALSDEAVTPPERWQGIEPEECKQKHPGKLCPTNCGCHCEPCRNLTVGAFDASKAFDTTSSYQWDAWDCECKVCRVKCDNQIPDEDFNPHAAYGQNLCEDCQRGSHYEDKGAVADARLQGTM